MRAKIAGACAALLTVSALGGCSADVETEEVSVVGLGLSTTGSIIEPFTYGPRAVNGHPDAAGTCVYPPIALKIANTNLSIAYSWTASPDGAFSLNDRHTEGSYLCASSGDKTLTLTGVLDGQSQSTSVSVTCNGAACPPCGAPGNPDTTPPHIDCPADQTVECTSGTGSAAFTPSASDECNLAGSSCDPAAGTPLGVGITTETCTALDASGNAASCSFAVSVVDTLPPAVTTAAPKALSPARHQYATLSLSDCVASVSDQCRGALDIGAVGTITRVSSDEPEDARGRGDGVTCNDIVIASSTTAELRVERATRGNGRVYHVYFDVTDASGNTTSSVCTASVSGGRRGTSDLPTNLQTDGPTDLVLEVSPAAAPVDDGCAYCVGTGCGTCPGHRASCTF